MPTILALSDDVSFCDVCGRIVFLDIASDRYFQLPLELEHTFRAYLGNGVGNKTDIDALVELGILAEPLSPSVGVPVAQLSDPARSAMEQAWVRSNRVGAMVFLDVFSAVAGTYVALRMSTLKRVLERLSQHRRRHVCSPESGVEISKAQQASAAAALFRNARAFVPIQPRCLLDSIALVRFLSKRRHHACIVFGVTRDPFSAHCWVQTEDIVLNDSVGDVRTYTPIRTV
jgi:hypothetical protein